MEDEVRAFFGRYAQLFAQALAGEADLDQVAALYANEFIAASPAGVMGGKNDEAFKASMAEGYERYRAMGTKAMRLGEVRVSPMDELHCVAHVAWTAVYAREGRPDIEIGFEVHYLVQKRGAEPKVFGWVSGDEEAVLKAHGVI